jgi:hypothetical protein
MFMSLAIREWAEAGDHELERVDVDAVNDDDERVVTPEPGTLPVVRLLDAETGRLVWEGLPESEGDFLAILQDHSRKREPPKAEQPKPLPSPPKTKPPRVGPLRRR